SRAGPSWDNRPRAPYAPTTDQGSQQSRERGDRPEQPHQDGMNKTTVLDRGSAAPSSPAPTAEWSQSDGITVRSDSQRTFATKFANFRLMHCSKPSSFDHLVGAGEQRRWHIADLEHHARARHPRYRQAR